MSEALTHRLTVAVGGQPETGQRGGGRGVSSVRGVRPRRGYAIRTVGGVQVLGLLKEAVVGEGVGDAGCGRDVEGGIAGVVEGEAGGDVAGSAGPGAL